MSIHPPIPDELSVEVKDFIGQLLTKDPCRRLGGGPSDSEELKQHSFFKVRSFRHVHIRSTYRGPSAVFIWITKPNLIGKQQNLNWDDVARKMVRAPFIPRIIDELDVSNFAEEFTGMAPTDSPAIVPTNVDKIFKVQQLNKFRKRRPFLNCCLVYRVTPI